MAYPETKFDRAQQRAADEINNSYLAALEAAGPDACPNCLHTDGGRCWCCTTPDVIDRLHTEALEMDR